MKNKKPEKFSNGIPRRWNLVMEMVGSLWQESSVRAPSNAEIDKNILWK